MKSKTSCFNKAIPRYALRYTWPLYTLAAAFWAVVAYYMVRGTVNSCLQGYTGANPIDLAANQLRIDYISLSTGAVFFYLGYGCAAACLLQRHLYTQRSTISYHALPVNRTQIFTGHLAAGLVIGAAPAVGAVLGGLVGLIGVPAAVFNAGVKAMGPLVAVAAAAWLWSYGFAYFCGLFTGQAAAAVALYGIFNFFAPGMTAVLEALCYLMLHGYAGNTRLFSLSMRLSPAVYMFNEVRSEENALGLYVLRGWGAVAWAAAAGAAFLAAAYLIYRHYPLEAAGQLIAWRPLRQVFAVGVSVCMAGCGAAFVVGELSGIPYAETPVQRAVLLLWLLGFAAVGYFGARMLLQKTFRVLGRRNLAVFGGTALALCLGWALLANGGLGYETWVPRAEQLTEASVEISGGVQWGPLYWYGPVTVADDTAKQALCAWHRDYLDAYSLEWARERVTEGEARGDSSHSIGVRISYHMADGSVLRRSYTFPGLEPELAQPGSLTWRLNDIIAGALDPAAVTEQPGLLDEGLWMSRDGYDVTYDYARADVLAALAADLAALPGRADILAYQEQVRGSTVMEMYRRDPESGNRYQMRLTVDARTPQLAKLLNGE